VMITENYSGSRAYAQSKLAQIMFTIDLAEELKEPASPSIRCIRRPT
jgi:NAD(P)-dependent dehydrogenase (short-subunit alcohol dehydrogenase family)